jgi:lipase chaperone LimK
MGRLKQYVQYFDHLVQLRKSNEALSTGALRFLHAKPGNTRLVLERVNENEHLLIFVNASRRSAM